jgi:aerobic-type carbon monoxide dehydrogenase small subunit (CoxS/CutS family)
MPTEIRLKVNGVDYTRTVEPRKLLSDFIREDLELTGTHVGCEHGVCGACTILLDGRTARACLIFAVQADGAEIVTIEGLAPNGELNRLQKAFWENHGLQCGFCTPGTLLTATELLRDNPNPSEDEIRESMSGVLCRCTGYHHILESVKAAASGKDPGA